MSTTPNPGMKASVIKLMRSQFGSMPLFFLTRKWQSGKITASIHLGDFKKHQSIKGSLAYISSHELPSDDDFETPKNFFERLASTDIAKPLELSNYFSVVKSEYKNHEFLVINKYYSVEDDYYLCIPYKDNNDEVIGFYFPILSADQFDKVNVPFIDKLLKVL